MVLLITCAFNPTVFAISYFATVTLNPILSISSRVLLWSDKLLHYSQICQTVFDAAKNIYLGDIKVKRASILLEKLDNYLKNKANKPCCHCKDGKGNCQKNQANKTDRYTKPQSYLK